MPTKPLVTVVVPCRNYARFLGDCIGSLMVQQLDVELDILIIDDASEDDTPRWCEMLHNVYRDRIRVIRFEENVGHTAVFNTGIAQARGQFFTIVSADDQLTIGALGRAVGVMQEYPQIGLVYGHCISVDEQGRKLNGSGQGLYPIPRISRGRAALFRGDQWVRQVCSTGKCFVTGSEAVLRTSVQRTAGVYDPALGHSADHEMWLRVAYYGDIAYLSGVDQLLYRVHPRSLQRTVYAGRLFDIEARLAAFRSAHAKGVITDANLAVAERAIVRLIKRRETWLDRVLLNRLRWHYARYTGIAV